MQHSRVISTYYSDKFLVSNDYFEDVVIFVMLFGIDFTRFHPSTRMKVPKYFEIVRGS